MLVRVLYFTILLVSIILYQFNNSLFIIAIIAAFSTLFFALNKEINFGSIILPKFRLISKYSIVVILLQLLYYLNTPVTLDSFDTGWIFLSCSAFYPLVNGKTLMIIIIFGPMIEELIFRIILLVEHKAIWMITYAISGSLFFSLMHSNFLHSLIFALLMCLIVYTTRNLFLAIIVHSVNNIIDLIVHNSFMKLAFSRQNYQLFDGILFNFIILSVSFLLVFTVVSILKNDIQRAIRNLKRSDQFGSRDFHNHF